MGYRLQGPELKRETTRELLSHGLVPGVVQVPPAARVAGQAPEGAAGVRGVRIGVHAQTVCGGRARPAEGRERPPGLIVRGSGPARSRGRAAPR